MTLSAPTRQQPLPVFSPAGPTEPATWIRTHGIEVLVPAADQVVTPYMERKKEWDGTVLSAVLDSLTPKSSFLDVGAMVGYFSASVAKKIPDGRIVAVEPLRSNLELASLNLSNFDNTLLLEGAVTDSPDEAWAVIPDETNRGNTRVGVASGGAAADAADRVPTATLRSLVKRYRSDVVKIDVQGLERQVLDSLGPGRGLPRNLTVFTEVSPAAWAGESAIAEMVERFAASGFDAYFLGEGSAYSAFSSTRLARLVGFGSRWVDHFDMVLTRGRYAATIKNRI
ncbi:FkbM family methyltransferase [Herbiconiux sp. A18JL235]|uniref:FkbM family methyltransferase n=1 Tax=Herbiconiux sp. A18JL235 TaxID=3152363 RepID=A0AB39BJE3_9MICO